MTSSVQKGSCQPISLIQAALNKRAVEQTEANEAQDGMGNTLSGTGASTLKMHKDSEGKTDVSRINIQDVLKR